jgi:hypothetical protein
MSRSRVLLRFSIWLILIVVCVSALAVAGCGRSRPGSGPAAGTGPGTAARPADKTQQKRCASDVKWLRTELPRWHKNLFFSLSQTEWNDLLDDLARRGGSLGREEYIVAVAQTLARLGDAHTGLGIRDATAGTGLFPFGCLWFSDGITVVGAGAGRVNLVGAKLVAIENTPVDRVVELLETIVSHENKSKAEAMVPEYLAVPEVLKGLGIIGKSSRAKFTFVGRDGKEFSVVLPRMEATRFAWAPISSYPDGLTWPEAWLSADVIRHIYIESSKTLYIQYNSCRGDITEQVKAIDDTLRGRSVERIVVDLRRNTGGNSEVIRPLIRMLAARPEVKEPGRFFVLIGPRTFSSALFAAFYLKSDIPTTVFLGEPTGGRPNHYGEVRTALLPGCGLRIGYSTQYFQLAPDGDPPSLMPDHTVTMSSTEFLAGRDPVLEAAIAYRPR